MRLLRLSCRGILLRGFVGMLLRGMDLGEMLFRRAMADLIARELGMYSGSSGTVDSIVGIGLQSDFQWDGEDLIEALRRRMDVSDRR